MHAGLSPSLGTVSHPVGRIVWNEEDITKSSVSAEIPVSSLDLGNEEWNRKTLKTFLDAEKYPTASFQSSTIRVISESLLEVDGELRMAGGEHTDNLHHGHQRQQTAPADLQKNAWHAGFH